MEMLPQSVPLWKSGNMLEDIWYGMRVLTMVLTTQVVVKMPESTTLIGNNVAMMF